jgi:hypothetical protein
MSFCSFFMISIEMKSRIHVLSPRCRGREYTKKIVYVVIRIEDERRKMDFYENYSNLLVFMLRFSLSPSIISSCTFFASIPMYYRISAQDFRAEEE